MWGGNSSFDICVFRVSSIGMNHQLHVGDMLRLASIAHPRYTSEEAKTAADLTVAADRARVAEVLTDEFNGIYGFQEGENQGSAISLASSGADAVNAEKLGLKGISANGDGDLAHEITAEGMTATRLAKPGRPEYVMLQDAMMRAFDGMLKPYKIAEERTEDTIQVTYGGDELFATLKARGGELPQSILKAVYSTYSAPVCISALPNTTLYRNLSMLLPHDVKSNSANLRNVVLKIDPRMCKIDTIFTFKPVRYAAY